MIDIFSTIIASRFLCGFTDAREPPRGLTAEGRAPKSSTQAQSRGQMNLNSHGTVTVLRDQTDSEQREARRIYSDSAKIRVR